MLPQSVTVGIQKKPVLQADDYCSSTILLYAEVCAPPPPLSLSRSLPLFPSHPRRAVDPATLAVDGKKSLSFRASGCVIWKENK